MGEGQDVLSGSFDLPAMNAADDRLAALEADRGRVHAGELRVVLEQHRLHTAAGLGLSAVPHVALVLSCSEHRAHQLLSDAQVLEPLPGAFEALEVGLLTVEQSRRLVDAIAPLPLTQRLEAWLRLQARLLDRESPLPPARLAELLRGWVIQVDPKDATERRKQAEADGRVDYRRRSDGLTDLHLSGLNGPDAQAVLQNIRRHADPMPGGDPRSADKRLLDAAKDLLLGRTPFSFDGVHCQPGCDCRPGQAAPCGADITVFVPQGGALRTTDELAYLVGHGPIEPDLLADLLAAAPLLRAVFVDADGVPVGDSPLVIRPPRNDPAALREALLRLVNSPPGPHQPRHPGDHLRPDPDPPGEEVTGPGPPDADQPGAAPPSTAPPDPDRRRLGADLTLLRQVLDRARAAADAARPQVLAHPHPAGTPGPYAPSRRLRRFLRARSPRCEWPGCGARATRCDLDHDLAHPHGPTCPCNLGPLCRRHHRVKQNDWTKQRARDNSTRWTSPGGRTWTSPTPTSRRKLRSGRSRRCHRYPASSTSSARSRSTKRSGSSTPAAPSGTTPPPTSSAPSTSNPTRSTRTPTATPPGAPTSTTPTPGTTSPTPPAPEPRCPAESIDSAVQRHDPAAMPEDATRSPISAEDLAISLAVREDLGREHDGAVVAEFLDRVGTAIDARVDAKVAEAAEARPPRRAQNDGVSSALAFASLGVGIPISGIALGTTDGSATGLVALAIAWTGIAAVNVVHNRGRR